MAFFHVSIVIEAPDQDALRVRMGDWKLTPGAVVKSVVQIPETPVVVPFTVPHTGEVAHPDPHPEQPPHPTHVPETDPDAALIALAKKQGHNPHEDVVERHEAKVKEKAT